MKIISLLNAIWANQRRNFSHPLPAVFSPAILLLLCSYAAIAQDADSHVMASTEAAQKAAVSPIRYSGILYSASNRRDPFLNPLLRSKEKRTDTEQDRGTPPPGIGGTYISQAKLQGISIRDKGRLAIVRGADDRAYFLREGDRLFDGYIKKIESDFITLVLETRMQSGKVITREVTKRLRTP
jgi:Tfp pilus assembly protein PilP